jgi:hypothetical protein
MVYDEDFVEKLRKLPDAEIIKIHKELMCEWSEYIHYNRNTSIVGQKAIDLEEVARERNIVFSIYDSECKS